MDCRTVHEQLSAYVDGDLPAPMREALDRHFAQCPACQRTCVELQTVIAWVRDLPSIAPSPTFLHQVTAQVERRAAPAGGTLVRRLVGALPLQVAAALVFVVSAVLVWQLTPYVWRTSPIEAPRPSEPWISQERAIAPTMDLPPEPFFGEPPPPAPLVQVPQRSWWMAREESWRLARDVSAMPMVVGGPAEGRGGELALFPSLVLRAADPVQTAQQVWEMVPRLGGALLHAQGMATPAARASRGPVRVTVTLPAERYQALQEGIAQLPGIAVVEERAAFIGRELLPAAGGSLWRPDSSAATPPHLTLAITILPR
jgi:hypothetical protein